MPTSQLTDQIRSAVFSSKYLTKLKFGYKDVCVRSMKAYVGMEVQVHPSLNLALEELTGQLYAWVAVSVRRDPCGHQMADWAPELVWTIWRREKSLVSARDQTTDIECSSS